MNQQNNINTYQRVGQIERATQNRIVKMLSDNLGYDSLGDWEYREDNSNIEKEYLFKFLEKKGYSENIIKKALRELENITGNQQKELYQLNKEFYEAIRYGVSVKEEIGENNITVNFIDWNHLEENHFAVAEEVTIRGRKTKRPDIVLYINGIAVGVLELKRSTVSVGEGIRQNIGNQKKDYIDRFFITNQLVMAGNNTEGLRYGTTQTPEEYYFKWNKDDTDFLEVENRLEREIMQFCQKSRILDIIYNFVVFDSGIKKICQHNQFFAVKEARKKVENNEGGVIWHTQGSGKSLTMVWLAKWIHENIDDSRVLLLTDRIELDQQIEGVFKGVGEDIYRTKNGKDLIDNLNISDNWLIASLVHKFRGSRGESDAVDKYLEDLKKELPDNFSPKGNIFVFVDECHRTHTGKLHKAMKNILPEATFIGFTGTPLLKHDKTNSIVVWGNYIHRYRYDEAVADGFVLDLRYEARRVPQQITNQEKIDQYFEEKTKGLTDYAKNQLKQRWGTMQALLSSSSRMERIVFDVIDDFEKKPRLKSGRGNAMLVASSISEACQYYEIFQRHGFEKCAVITSYDMSALNTEDREYRIYKEMLGDKNAKTFEKEVKKKFIKEPGQMQLLIVVDKLLTGFDAPPATYLYIDKKMQDHGLFQAICRVNRIHEEDKDFGYIIDYRDLFQKLEKAVINYTSGGFANFDRDDVLGILKDKLEMGKEKLDESLESVRALCESVEEPKSSAAYIKYFCGDTGNIYSLQENETKRVKLYKLVSTLLRAYADIAGEMEDAGYSSEEKEKIKKEVVYYNNVKDEIKLASGDYIDLKKYNPSMRSLLDRYVYAHDSEKLSSLEKKPLIDLLIEKGVNFEEDLPENIRKNKESVAEVIENNARKLITDEMPNNPKYYQRMSEILDDLIRRRKEEEIEYQKYLEEFAQLSKEIKNPETSSSYPEGVNTSGKRALYDNIPKDKAMYVHDAVIESRKDGWRGHSLKEREVRKSIKKKLPNMSDEKIEEIFEIIKNHEEY
jgi:type I restriction enzyme, R subunit